MIANAGFDITGTPNFQRSFGGAKGSPIACSANYPTFGTRDKLSVATIGEVLEKHRLGEPLEPELVKFKRALRGT